MRKVNTFDYLTGKVMHENVTFHQFGLEVIEHHEGSSSYSVAIIELHDGSVITWGVNNIQFIEPISNGSALLTNYLGMLQDALEKIIQASALIESEKRPVGLYRR